MKAITKILPLCLAVILFSIQSFAQLDMNKDRGKRFYTSDEVKKMCGVPIDPAKTPGLQAKQDSMYNDYLSRRGGFQKTETTPNWQWAMSRVEDQLSCGDCWVHAATGIAEGQLQILYGSRIGNNGIDMNELEVPDACLGGFPTWAEYYIETEKIGSEVGSYPNLQGVKWSILSYGTVSGITATKNALANGAVAACFYVYADFSYFFNDNPTGIYHYDGHSALVGGHAVVIVSYDDAQQYWLCKNSWGETWADNGYFRIGYGQCYIETWENSTVAANTSCYAKIVPNLQTFQNAMGSSFATDEWTYVLSSTSINNGATVNVPSSAYVTFAGGASLTSNGVLNVNGTASSPVTFTAQSGNSAGSWGSIVLSGSGASGSTLNYCNIRYGMQVQAVSTSNITIQNCAIQEVEQGVRFTSSTGSATSNTLTSSTIYHGIIVENGSTVNCYQNTVTKQPGYQSGAGILYVGSGGKLYQNDVKGWSWGVGAIWGASPYFYDFNMYGGRTNRIRNCFYGVNVYHQSYPVIGYPAGPYQEHSIHDNTYNVALNIDNFTASTLYACHVYWGSQVPPAQCLIGNGSTIQTYGMNLAYDPWAGYPRMAGSDLAAIGTLSSSVVSANPAAASIAPTDPPQAQDPLFDGRLLRLQDRNKEAKDFFLSYLAKRPGEQEAYVALFDCANDETIGEITSFFTHLPKEAVKEHKLLLGYLYLRQGKSDLAKQVNDELIHGNPNTPLATRARLNNFYIALHNDNDPTTAATILQGVVDNAKGASANEGAALELSLAQQALEVYQQVHSGKASLRHQPTTQPAPSTPTQAGIAVNYPNPFNPSTVISYQLPITSHVSLKVYDMLGREVATLVDGQKEAGYHTATFDASHLPSGIYFARLQAGNEIQTRKLSLIK